MNKPKLLIVEDDESIRTQLKYALQHEYTVSFAEDHAQAMAQLHEFKPSVVSLDLGLPPSPNSAEEGFKVLEGILQVAPLTKVIVLTGKNERENALRALRLGAFDYHLKPIELEEFKVMLRRAAYLQELELESETALKGLEETIGFEEILGNTATMRDIFKVIQRVAKTEATVLIEGQSGTGKELIAKAIHSRSRRREGPFVAINCGAIPDTLLEAELYGHERGAFTGAHIQRKGRFELADRGTLFLDEIGELSVSLQVKLLRFLQERTLERIGGRDLIRLDLRVIAATNRDLNAQLQLGRFREDLYYRLSTVTIKVPPLKERGEDILLLANAFLRRARLEHRRKARFSPEALQALMAYGWPGNIRELENKVNRAVIMARGNLIEPCDLDLELPRPHSSSSLKEARERVERDAIVEVLSRNRGNISRAAQELGVSRPTLHALLGKHHISPKAFFT